MFVVLMCFDKLKGKCNQREVEIMFEHILFGLNSLTGGEVMMRLVKLEFGDETLTVTMNGKLRMGNRSRIVRHGRVEVQKYG